MRLKAFLACSAVCWGLVAATPAVAQDAQAELLFDQGRTLMADQRWAEAAAKFEASDRVDPSPGTLLNLAECYVHLDRKASAWSTYRAAAGLAANLGQRERAQYAEQRALELAAQQSTLTLVVPAAARVDGLSITVRGAQISEELFGTPLPTDSGSFQVRVEAPGKATWTTSVTLRAERDTVELAIPELAPLPTEFTPSPTSSSEGSGDSELRSPGHERRVLEQTPAHGDAPPATWNSADAGHQRLWGLVLGGSGLLAAGAGTWSFLSGKDTIHRANCPGEVCVEGTGNPELHEEGRSKEMLGVGLLVLGGAMVAGGIGLVLTAPPSAPGGSPEIAISARGDAAGARLDLSTQFW